MEVCSSGVGRGSGGTVRSVDGVGRRRGKGEEERESRGKGKRGRAGIFF